MPMIGEQSCASHDGGQRSQSRSAGDQKHDQELIFYGVYRFDSGKDLAGHHSWQGNKTNRRHAIDGRHEPASQRIAQDWEQRLIAGTSERKARLHRGSLAHQTIGEHIQAQTYSCHGVTQDHAQQGQRIARMIPRLGVQLRQKRKHRDGTGSQ